ncbi:MAG: hypothetical protein R2939_02135 [Kofleriaceae bacterium]
MTPDVGKDIASLCSKCGDVWHVVVAKVGDEIKQVLCKECGARHRYRNPDKNAVKTKRAAPSKIGRPARPAPVARIDEPAVAADLSRPPRRYAASEAFAVGERVDHPTFGQGVVEAATEPGKVTVFFATGRRVLACAKAASPSGGLARPRPFDHSGPTAGGKPVGGA